MDDTDAGFPPDEEPKTRGESERERETGGRERPTSGNIASAVNSIRTLP